MSIYRNVIWYMKGLREYTKSGYEAAAKNFHLTDLEVDCSSRIFVITGGNSGIGYDCALEIAKRQGTVHLVCRNDTLGNKAKEDIISQTGNDRVFLHILDLSHPQRVAEFTKAFTNTNHKLHVLINNAGCMVNERQQTSDGLDVNFATNTLGTYLVTLGLLDCLSKSDDPRVIFVSSGGMLVQRLNDDFNIAKTSKYDGVMVYAQNKRQQVVICEEFAKKYPNIQFASMHPGWADTPAVRSSMPEFYEKMKDRLRTSAQGADTVLWLAISLAAKGFPSGSFFQDRVPVEKHLPLAWTRTSDTENEDFMGKLDKVAQNFKDTQSELK